MFGDFFETYKNNFKILYPSSERSASLSLKGRNLCDTLDSGKSHERWEEPKIEKRLDSSTLDDDKDIKKAIEILKNTDANFFDENRNLKADKVSASDIETVITPAMSNVDLNHMSASNPTKILARQLDQKLQEQTSDFGSTFVFASERYNNTKSDYYKTALDQIKQNQILSADQNILDLLNAKHDDAEKLKLISQVIESNKKLAEPFSKISTEARKSLQKNVESLIQNRWATLNKQNLNPQQKYYLAWASQLLTSTPSSEGVGKTPLYLQDARFYGKDFKRYDISTLHQFATDSLHPTCITCTQPKRSTDTEGIENNNLTREILNGGGDTYTKIKSISSTDMVTSPEILYNLSVALNYLTTNVDGDMPTLTEEPPEYTK